MTTQNLPGTNAARHGTGDADLTIMIAAHDAFRRDLTRLARTASAAHDPARPARRARLPPAATALSVLAAMEAEHELIDPLLAAVDTAFARDEPPADVIGALTTSLTGHLAHEERAGVPRIGVTLTAAEWRGAGRAMARKNGLSASAEMFAWILDGTDREHRNAPLAQPPPPLRVLYRARW